METDKAGRSPSRAHAANLKQSPALRAVRAAFEIMRPSLQEIADGYGDTWNDDLKALIEREAAPEVFQMTAEQAHGMIRNLGRQPLRHVKYKGRFLVDSTIGERFDEAESDWGFAALAIRDLLDDLTVLGFLPESTLAWKQQRRDQLELATRLRKLSARLSDPESLQDDLETWNHMARRCGAAGSFDDFRRNANFFAAAAEGAVHIGDEAERSTVEQVDQIKAQHRHGALQVFIGQHLFPTFEAIYGRDGRPNRPDGEIADGPFVNFAETFLEVVGLTRTRETIVGYLPLGRKKSKRLSDL